MSVKLSAEKLPILLALFALCCALPVGADEPPLGLETIQVEPPSPGEEELCRLSVEIHNRGERAASRFAFAVEIDGQPQPPYRGRLFLHPVAPGERTRLPLFRFWSTETSRPVPEDGRVTVVVRLLEAQWVEIDDGTEVPVGEVPGLPLERSLTFELRR